MNKRVPLSAAMLLISAFLVWGEAVPPEMFAGLSSEEFPVREKSQESLLLWAREKPSTRAASLADLPSDEDPEIRKRSYEVLRALSDDDYMSDGQGYLGIMMAEEILNAAAEGKPAVGIRISYVMKESPASTAGLKAGDLIIALDGKSWSQEGAINVFMEVIAAKKPLVDVVLTVSRGAAEPAAVTVKLGKRPVPDLRDVSGDLQLLDKRAKDEHYSEWMKRLKAGKG